MHIAAARTARFREDFPTPAGKRGLAYVYDPVQLRDWYEARQKVNA
jgi:hypothetical protein